MISGFFDSRALQPTPRVRVSLFLPATGAQFGSVDFCIDTGTDESILHPADALRLGFDLRDLVQAQPTWGKPEELIGIGGTVPTYRVAALYIFEHERPRRFQRVSGLIHVTKWMPENDALPSLLGWDILQHFRFSMNWSARTVTLHDDADPPSV